MEGRKIFKTIIGVDAQITNIKPFTTSQLKDARNHCGAVAMANVLLLHNLIDSQVQSLKEVYNTVGDGPVVFLSKIINKHYKILKYRYIRPKNIVKRKSKSSFYLVCMPLSLIEWHWIVVLDIISIDAKEYFVLFDGWNRFVRYLEVDKMKFAFVLEITKTPTN